MKACKHYHYWAMTDKVRDALNIYWCPDCGALRTAKWLGWIKPGGEKAAHKRYLRVATEG